MGLSGDTKKHNQRVVGIALLHHPVLGDGRDVPVRVVAVPQRPQAGSWVYPSFILYFLYSMKYIYSQN